MTRLARFRVDIVVVAGLFLMSALLVSMHVGGYTKLSPIDELQHIDYLYQIPDHPEPDDRVGQRALHQQLCRGVDAEGFGPPACQAGRLDPKVFQEKGYNTAAGYTPAYYAITRVGAETLLLLTPLDDLVTAGRLTGGLWLGLGLGLIYVVGRVRRISRLPLVAVTVLLGASPALLFPSSTIAPDAAALVAGGLMMLTLTWWERRPSWRSAGLLVLACVLATAIKLTYLVAVGLVGLYLLVRWWRGRSPRSLPRTTPLLAVACGIAFLVVPVAWATYLATLPQITPDDLPAMATQFAVTGFPWTGLSDSLLVLLSPLSSPWVPVGSPQLTYLTTSVVSIVITAGAVAAGVFGAAREPERDLARATLLAALVGAAGLVVMGYLMAGSYIPLPARYGAALVPALALSAAAAAQRRSAGWILLAVAVVTATLTAVRLADLS